MTSDRPSRPRAEPSETGAERSCEAPPAVSSRDLLRGARMLVIRHGDEDYRLQVTRAGKLILTK